MERFATITWFSFWEIATDSWHGLRTRSNWTPVTSQTPPMTSHGILYGRRSQQSE